jgi:acetylornithine deacetylase/succinyl-diaminopimelate desuccinylase-like protein
MRSSPDTELQARLGADIAALCRFDRASASEGERQAAEWVASRLREMGLEPELEDFHFYPDYWNAWGSHAGLAGAPFVYNQADLTMQVMCSRGLSSAG